MKKVLICFLIGSVALFSACSKTPLTQLDLDLNKEQAKASKACYDSKKVDLTGVPSESIPYILMSTNFSDTILAITGNDPCKQTNAFDAQIAEVESKNKTVEKLGGGALGVAKMAIGVYGATEIVDSVVSNAGVKVTGDGNSVSTASDSAKVTGGSPYTDKGNSGNASSNVESDLTSEQDSRNSVVSDNTTTTESVPVAEVVVP